jgi:ribosomal protein S18 acetylase RimI-like enzyme
MTTSEFRVLDPVADIGAVLELMQRGADYIRLEDGHGPDAVRAEDFLTALVPGGRADQAVKLGIMQAGRMVGIIDLGFGYPQEDDAYIGLLLLDPAVRGQGLGVAARSHVEAIARQRGAKRMLVAVLAENPGGQAFWQSQGFVPEKRFEPLPDDPLGHVRIRRVKQLLAGV